jgi:hypothetical protein
LPNIHCNRICGSSASVGRCSDAEEKRRLVAGTGVGSSCETLVGSQTVSIIAQYYRLNILQYISPQTQYCCALFHFARGLRQVNTLNDCDASCVATALTLCLKKKQNSPLDQRMIKTKIAVLKQLTTDLRLSDPSD